MDGFRNAVWDVQMSVRLLLLLCGVFVVSRIVMPTTPITSKHVEHPPHPSSSKHVEHSPVNIHGPVVAFFLPPNMHHVPVSEVMSTTCILRLAITHKTHRA